MDFIALDVETANADLSTICQIGLVRFRDGRPVEKLSSLVNPLDEFDLINSSIHGITEEDVKDAPTWKLIVPEVLSFIGPDVIATHGAFDRSATSQASERHQTSKIENTWLDVCRIARRAWPDVTQKGYGLANLAKKFSIEFKHHDAVEDAAASGIILTHAIRETGLSIQDWIIRSKQPINPHAQHHAQSGNNEGPLHGETIVFTGELNVPRRDASARAAQAGCDVADGVNKHTTLLVVGDQDIRKLHGKTKSAKHTKAEQLIAKGQMIRILTESDFLKLTA